MNDRIQISRRGFTLGTLGVLGSVGLAALTGCRSEARAGGGAYANKGMDFFFFVTLSEAIERRTKELGLPFNTTDAKQDSSQQFNDAKSLLVQQPAFLIVDTVDSRAWKPIARQAQQQGVPFGAVDSLVNEGVLDFQVAFDNAGAGKLAAEETVRLLTERYGEPRGQVFNGYGALSSAAWNARKIAFEEVMAGYPDIQLISRPTEGAETIARQVAGATLAEFPKLDALHGPSDSITRGMITAMETSGRLKQVGEDGHIIVTTIDGEPQALNWFRKGLVDAPVSQDPVAYGEICVDMLTGYSMKGKPVPLGEYVNTDYYWERSVVEDTENGPVMTIPPYVINHGNVDDPRQWANVVTDKWGVEQ